MGLLGDPSDKADNFTQGAATDCPKGKVRRTGEITAETWAWIREKKPCLNVGQTEAVIARLEEVEAENARLKERIDLLEDQLDMAWEQSLGEDL